MFRRTSAIDEFSHDLFSIAVGGLLSKEIYSKDRNPSLTLNKARLHCTFNPLSVSAILLSSFVIFDINITHSIKFGITHEYCTVNTDLSRFQWTVLYCTVAAYCGLVGEMNWGWHRGLGVWTTNWIPEMISEGNLMAEYSTRRNASLLMIRRKHQIPCSRNEWISHYCCALVSDPSKYTLRLFGVRTTPDGNLLPRRKIPNK